MKLAVNYSNPAAEFAEAGRIEVDLFKCPEWPELVQRVGPECCYVHFALSAGRGKLDGIDWAAHRELYGRTATPHVNVHLSPTISFYPRMGLHSHEPEHCGAVIRAASADVGKVRQQFEGAGVAVENLMWAPRPPWMIPEAGLLPEVVDGVVRGTDSGLVLDLAHAEIAARHFGREARGYIDDLPTDRLAELHVSGTRLVDGLWIDHYPLAEHNWRLAEWALGRIAAGDWPRPAIVTLEYGGVGPGFEERTDAGVLLEQLPRLAGMLPA